MSDQSYFTQVPTPPIQSMMSPVASIFSDAPSLESYNSNFLGAAASASTHQYYPQSSLSDLQSQQVFRLLNMPNAPQELRLLFLSGLWDQYGPAAHYRTCLEVYERFVANGLKPPRHDPPWELNEASPLYMALCLDRSATLEAGRLACQSAGIPFPENLPEPDIRKINVSALTFNPLLRPTFNSFLPSMNWTDSRRYDLWDAGISAPTLPTFDENAMQSLMSGQNIDIAQWVEHNRLSPDEPIASLLTTQALAGLPIPQAFFSANANAMALSASSPRDLEDVPPVESSGPPSEPEASQTPTETEMEEEEEVAREVAPLLNTQDKASTEEKDTTIELRRSRRLTEIRSKPITRAHTIAVIRVTH